MSTRDLDSRLPRDLCERLNFVFAANDGLQLYDDVEPDDSDDCEWIDPAATAVMNRHNVRPSR